MGRYAKRIAGAMLVLLIVGVAPGQAAVEERHADHEELRALLVAAAEALNSRNIDALAPLFHDTFVITTVDQQAFTDLPSLKTYFNGLLDGPNAPLKSMVFQPKAEVKTQFIDDTTGIDYGFSNDIYTFPNGDVRTMKTRWVASLTKHNGRWKMMGLQLGANILENPVTDAAKRAAWWFATGGLILGFILRGLLKSRRA